MDWREAVMELSEEQKDKLLIAVLSHEIDNLGMDANVVCWNEEEGEFYCPHSGERFFDEMG